MGEEEFLHWDMNLARIIEEINTTGREPHLFGVHCKAAVLNESRFVFVPGTHTAASLLEIFNAYRQLYPKFADKKQPKTGFDAKKPDPLNLVGRKVEIPLQPNSAAFWSPYTLHGTKANKAKKGQTVKTKFGGYFTCVRPDQAWYASVTKGRNLRNDMLQDYWNGTLPESWPFGDKTSMYPLKWKNFPKMMRKYIAKLIAGHPWIVNETQADGKVVQRLKQPAPVGHQPKKLTKLGSYVHYVEDWKVFYANGGKFDELIKQTKAEEAAAGAAPAAAGVAPLALVAVSAGAAPAPMSRSEGKRPADDMDRADNGAGAASAPAKRKPDGSAKDPITID
jgi:hypothetical protein